MDRVGADKKPSITMCELSKDGSIKTNFIGAKDQLTNILTEALGRV
jgi:hypothetical protein